MANYTPTSWVNGQSPAINAQNLNHVESGIAALYMIAGLLYGDGNGNIGTKAIDSSPASGSQNLITSGAVESAISSLSTALSDLAQQMGNVVFTVTPEGLLNVSLKEEL